ncbi:hypothetical protein RAS2_22390 [Phycisphaerae bacterium RAS2]|nr:hypothetical protein RAS2_22390 [Phycisphaerae bacterium RAS2]
MTGKTRVRVTWCALAVSAVAAFLTPLPLVALLHDDEPETNAPAERFTLEYSGKSIDVMLGEPFVVEIEGRRVDMKLTAKRYRILELDGVSFRYPREFKFSAGKEKRFRTATLEGTDAMIVLYKYESGDASEFISALAKSLSNDWKRKKAKVKQSNRVQNLGAHTLKGKRIEIKTLGHSIRQDFVGLNTTSGVVVLMLQDSAPDQEKPSPQFADAVRMLKESFKISE